MNVNHTWKFTGHNFADIANLKPWLYAFILCCLPFKAFSQQTVSGVPYSVVHEIDKVATYELLPSYIQAQTKLKTEQASSKLKRLEFAHVFDIAFNPENSGEWVSLDNGDRIWRLGIVSKGAYSINLIFGTFELEPHVKLYLYSPDQQNLLGAYSSKNNNNSSVLAIEPIAGDSIIIELNVPEFVNDYGKLELAKLGHDYTNAFGNKFKSAYGITGSGSCNVDINCDEGLIWNREKYAVCKIIISSRDLCTGTLINNTSNDKTPYILTANHCIDTTIKAAASVFIFNYEKWKCGGVDGPKSLTVSGAQLIATTKELDFSLVKLYGLPNFSCRPYFAGWDRTGSQPLSSVTIHHPNGDYKKITIDNNPAVTASYVDDYNPNTHWLINKWEVGTTERGSSGSPLFNSNHLVVGDLTGGDANCTYSVRDYFAKFYNSWADYSDPKKQLKKWLDPLNTNLTILPGLDPYEAEKASCDTFSNILPQETLGLNTSSLSWGALSGHNSRLITQFAEKIDLNGVLKIPGIYLKVAKAYNASPLSFITIKLWEGGEVPGEEISTRSVYIKDLTAGEENYLEFDSTLFVTGPVFLGYSVNYSAPQDTFSVYQSNDRGVNGYSGMFIFNEGSWSNVSQLGASLHSSLAVSLISCSLIDNIPEIQEENVLHAFPNPISSGILTVELPGPFKVTTSIYDLAGKKRQVSVVQTESVLSVDTYDLTSGVYILKVVIPGKGVYNTKFIVVK